MFKTFTVGLLLAGLVGAAAPASAFQTYVSQVDKNGDGTMTYHFSVKVDDGETLMPGDGKTVGDFLTIYNFYGLVDGSVKSPAGWAFSSEEFGRTPAANGYPLVLPLDVPNTPNMTWTVTKPITAGGLIDGFTATTHVGSVVQGEYSALVTLPSPAVKGVAAESPGTSGTSKQALIGTLPTPGFLADVK